MLPHFMDGDYRWVHVCTLYCDWGEGQDHMCFRIQELEAVDVYVEIVQCEKHRFGLSAVHIVLNSQQNYVTGGLHSRDRTTTITLMAASLLYLSMVSGLRNRLTILIMIMA